MGGTGSGFCRFFAECETMMKITKKHSSNVIMSA
jgi:hypothetical protein